MCVCVGGGGGLDKTRFDKHIGFQNFTRKLGGLSGYPEVPGVSQDYPGHGEHPDTVETAVGPWIVPEPEKSFAIGQNRKGKQSLLESAYKKQRNECANF